MIKVLFIGDPHIQVSNLPEVELFLERLLKLVRANKPNLIVIAGDLLHTHERLHTLALNKAYEMVDMLRKIAPTYVLVGNHDLCNNQQFLTSNHWMNGMKEWENTIIVDKVEVLNIGEAKFVFAPYVPPGMFLKALNTIGNEWQNASCIFAHQEFAGCKMGAIISETGDKWSEELPLVVSGHIHSRQKIQKNIYYSGSAMQHAFGESEKNIIPILTFSGSDYNLEEIDLELPRKKIVYMDVENISDYKQKQTKDKVKLTVSGTYEEFKAVKKTKRYKELIKNGIKIVFKPKKIDRIKKVDKSFETDDTNFNMILRSLVDREKNPYLLQSYEKIIHGKKIEIADILIL